MSKNLLIVGMVMLTVMVPLSSYGQSQAADPAKENSSQNQMGPAPSEEELEKAKKEGEEELKKAQEEIKKDREEMEKAIEEAKKIRVKGSHYLREDEVKRLQEQALKGSPDAAYRLWGYYEFTNKRDLEKRDFWEVIAAENGHACAQYYYGVRLSMDSDPINKIRARFWWKKAAAKGYKSAISKLQEKPRSPLDVSMSKETAYDLHLINAWLDMAAKNAKKISTLPPEDPQVSKWRYWIKQDLDSAKERANKLPDEKLRSQVLDKVKKIEASVKKAPVAKEGRENENKEPGRAGK